MGAMFVAAFAAATFLPFPSEVLFAGLQLGGETSLFALILVASIGNTLGSFVNYAIGWQVDRFTGTRWFPITHAQLERAQVWYAKYGVWTLLLSWAPLGDAITLVAGVMRTPWWLFLLLVAFAKTARYVVMAALTAGVIAGIG
nr:YqaA family protein [Oceaniglobus ichthyenteri]